MSKNDGGPAFARSFYWREGMLAASQGQTGMTLRDWFAGQALVGHLHIDPAAQASYAKLAYALADSMIEARNQ